MKYQAPAENSAMAWLFPARWLRQRRPRQRLHPRHGPRRRARGRQLGLPIPARIQLPLPEIGSPLILVKVVREGRRARVLPLEGEQLYVQFPRALRTVGAVYVVKDLVRVERARQVPFLRAVGPFQLLRMEQPQPTRQKGQHAQAAR